MINNNLINNLSLIFSFLRSRFFSHSLYVVFALFLGFSLFDHVGLNSLSPVLSKLQNLSAAVFTLSGIWVAYSYPQAISAYTSPDTVKVIPTDETKRIENLVLIIITSAYVISSLLIFDFMYLLLRDSEVYKEFRMHFKLIGLSYVSYLSFLQIKAIFVVMLTNIVFVNELHRKRTEKIANDDL